MSEEFTQEELDKATELSKSIVKLLNGEQPNIASEALTVALAAVIYSTSHCMGCADRAVYIFGLNLRHELLEMSDEAGGHHTQGTQDTEEAPPKNHQH